MQNAGVLFVGASGLSRLALSGELTGWGLTEKLGDRYADSRRDSFQCMELRAFDVSALDSGRVTSNHPRPTVHLVCRDARLFSRPTNSLTEHAYRYAPEYPNMQDKSDATCHDLEMTSEDFLARAEKVVRAGLVPNLTAWATKALGPTNRAYFNSRRVQKAKTGVPPKTTLETARKLSAFAGVRWEWLMNGEGAMLPDGSTPIATHVSKGAGANLLVEISKCANSELRQALTAFALQQR